MGAHKGVGGVCDEGGGEDGEGGVCEAKADEEMCGRGEILVETGGERCGGEESVAEGGDRSGDSYEEG